MLDRAGKASYRPALSEGTCDAEVDVLLGICLHLQRRYVHHLPANPNVTLPDKHASVMNGLCQPLLEHLRLQTPLEHLLSTEQQDEVELLLLVSEETVADQPADQSTALKHALGVLRVQGKQHPRSLAHFRKHKLATPDLLLRAETVLAKKLELLVQALLLVRTPGGPARLAIWFCYGADE